MSNEDLDLMQYLVCFWTKLSK